MVRQLMLKQELVYDDIASAAKVGLIVLRTTQQKFFCFVLFCFVFFVCLFVFFLTEVIKTNGSLLFANKTIKHYIKKSNQLRHKKLIDFSKVDTATSSRNMHFFCNTVYVSRVRRVM